MRYTTTRKLQVQRLEDRAVPAFGFGSAFDFGGADFEAGSGIALDGVGNTYVSGYFTGTADFDPGPGTALLTSTGTWDAFAAKYLPDGTFQWATDLGPDSTSNGEKIAVQGSNAYATHVSLAGETQVARLDAATGAIQWNVVLGASGGVRAGIAVSPLEDIYVTGANALGGAFVTKLDSAGNATWSQSSTGGAADGKGVALDSAGNVFVTGSYAGATTFGTTSLTSRSGSIDAFVWKLNAGGASIWAGSMGGIGDDDGSSIAVDATGNAYVSGGWAYATGISQNNDFDPGPAVLKLTHQGGSDAFVLKLAPNANGTMKFSWAKDIGAGGLDKGNAVAVDTGGNVYTTGPFTVTVDFDPGNKKYFLTSSGGNDVFLSKLDTNGNFVAAAAMGGTSNESGWGIAFDSANSVYVTGLFRGTADFDPTAGVYNLTVNGSADAYVVKLNQSGMGPMAAGPALGIRGDAASDETLNVEVDPPASRLTEKSAREHKLAAGDFDPTVFLGLSLDQPPTYRKSVRIGLPDDPVADNGLLSVFE